MHEATSYHKAGYYLEYLQRLRGELEKASGLDVEWTTDRLCTFSVRRVNFERIRYCQPPDDWRQLLSVYHNLVIRGLPTYPTLQVEKFLLDNISKTVPMAETDDKDSIAFHDTLPGVLREAWVKSLARAHATIDHELTTFRAELDSAEERNFIEALSRKLGPSTYQLVECQRPFSSIVRSDEAKSFFDQRVDFSLETKDVKIVLEIDGKQHQEPKQKMLDERRDQFLRASKWEVVRIPASFVRQERIDEKIQYLTERFARDTFLLAAARNFSQPLSTHDAGRAALQLTMTPFALARIQWVILQAFITGCLDIKKPRLKIAVIEWDLPCAFLAFWDFVNSFNHLRSIAGFTRDLPRIELEIFRRHESELDDGVRTLEALSGISVQVSSEVEHIREDHFDMVFSVSTLQVGSRDLSQIIGQIPCVAIESVHSPRGPDPQIETALPIRYSLQQDPTESLIFLLQWIFRKRKFRGGQLEILRKSLALENLIGLLPTSGGKSLCYQLSALLQPGTTLVVDPLISLMVDQIDNLKRLQFDLTGLVSSDQNREEQGKSLERFVHRSLLLFFISPERLQIPAFREILKSLCQTTPVPYLVIDEAHCISEWGHDFRPSYLKLVENARKSCLYQGFQPTIVALTGTASSAVLSDIQREVGLSDEAIVTPETYDRPELEFDVTKCQSHDKWQKLKAKLLELPQRFGKLPEEFFNPQNAGIVFCPHVGWTYGIVKVASRIRSELQNFISDVRIYSGKPPKGYDNNKWKQDKAKNQRDFKENKTPLIVATKAFGMGIDKPNIRYTIHYSMPTSLEAFYQESGRAGRDGSKAICSLIFSGDHTHWTKVFDEMTNEELAAVLAPRTPGRHTMPEMDTSPPEDDIYRMLYFHAKSWRGIEKEYETIKDLVTSKIYPAIASLEFDETTLVRIPFGGDIANDEGEDSRSRTEKTLYRLSMLGLVVDYALDHNARMFEVEVTRRKDDYLKSVLLDYLSRYKPYDRDSFSQRIDKAHGSTTLEKCLRTLLDFVYGEIEKKRRQTILEMARVASTSPDNEAFRKALLNYLETSEFTKKLNKIAKEMAPQEWVDIISNVKDIQSAQRLLGGCRRALESNPDHPGLLLLSSFARVKTSDETAIDEFGRASRSLAESPLQESVQEQTLAKMIGMMALERPLAASALCYIALQEFPRREIARITLAYSEISSQAGKLALRVLLAYMLQEVQSARRHLVG